MCSCRLPVANTLACWQTHFRFRTNNQQRRLAQFGERNTAHRGTRAHTLEYKKLGFENFSLT